MSDTNHDDIVDRLMNPMWAHSEAPFESPQLDKEANLATMTDAADLIKRLRIVPEQRHTHYHVPDGSVLNAVRDIVEIKPYEPPDELRKQADAVIAMLALTGELGGKLEHESYAGFLRRILDFITLTAPQDGVEPHGDFADGRAAEFNAMRRRPDRSLAVAMIKGMIWGSIPSTVDEISAAIYDMMVDPARWPK